MVIPVSNAVPRLSTAYSLLSSWSLIVCLPINPTALQVGEMGVPMAYTTPAKEDSARDQGLAVARSSMAPDYYDGDTHGVSDGVPSCDTAVLSVVHRALVSPLLTDEPWGIVVANRIPMLVTASDVSIGAFLDELKPLLPAPLTYIDCGSSCSLNGVANGGTVVLRHLDRCGLAAQRQLMESLHLRPLGTQVIGTSLHSLFPLIAAGAFLDMLYYRLNIVYVELAARPTWVSTSTKER